MKIHKEINECTNCGHSKKAHKNIKYHKDGCNVVTQAGICYCSKFIEFANSKKSELKTNKEVFEEIMDDIPKLEMEEDIEYLERMFPKGDKRRGEAMVLLALARIEGANKK